MDVGHMEDAFKREFGYVSARPNGPVDAAFCCGAGYHIPRRLPTGEWAAISIQLFTTGLVVGIGLQTYRGRYCYERGADAIAALIEWDGKGDPSGPWVKYKGPGGERLGPGAIEP